MCFWSFWESWPLRVGRGVISCRRAVTVQPSSLFSTQAGADASKMQHTSQFLRTNARGRGPPTRNTIAQFLRKKFKISQHLSANRRHCSFSLTFPFPLTDSGLSPQKLYKFDKMATKLSLKRRKKTGVSSLERPETEVTIEDAVSSLAHPEAKSEAKSKDPDVANLTEPSPACTAFSAAAMQDQAMKNDSDDDLNDFQPPPDLRNLLLETIPPKSAAIYRKSWADFYKFLRLPEDQQPTEANYLFYFDYLRRTKKFKGSTLWTLYAHLNGCHQRLYGEFF